MLKTTLALLIGSVAMTAQAAFIDNAPSLFLLDDYWKGVILGMQDDPSLSNTECFAQITTFLTTKNEATTYTQAALTTAMSAQGLSTNMFSYYVSYAKRLQEAVLIFFNFYQ